MDIDSTELQDWEILHPNSASDSDLDLNSAKNQDTFVETEGLIQTNYFSMTTPFASEKGSAESDNSSWVDPGKGPEFPTKNSGEFWSVSQIERGNDVGVLDNPKVHMGFGGIDEMGDENKVKLREFEGITELGVVQISKMELDFGEIDDLGSESGKILEEFLSDSGGVGVGGVKFGDVEEMSEAWVEEEEENETVEGEKRDENVGVEVSIAPEQKRSMVWWKVPLELLKYCVFRVRPMWAFSVATAVIGFLILGRRLFKMKKKTKGLELKVTVDDKKVSQFMGRAARLNEAFSVVKRVPVIRPQLPAPGVSPWPAVSLR